MPPISRFLKRDAPIGFGLGLCSVLSFLYDVFVLKNFTDRLLGGLKKQKRFCGWQALRRAWLNRPRTRMDSICET
jgi:hypothetical protein